MATVNLDLPNRPKGSKVEVPDLGLLVNGESNNVDERTWERFKRRRPDLGIEGDTLTISHTKAQREVDQLQKARTAFDEGKANKQQLELVAEAEGVDLSSAKNNEDRVELINEARNPQE